MKTNTRRKYRNVIVGSVVSSCKLTTRRTCQGRSFAPSSSASASGVASSHPDKGGSFSAQILVVLIVRKKSSDLALSLILLRFGNSIPLAQHQSLHPSRFFPAISRHLSSCKSEGSFPYLTCVCSFGFSDELSIITCKEYISERRH